MFGVKIIIKSRTLLRLEKFLSTEDRTILNIDNHKKGRISHHEVFFAIWTR